MLISFIFLKVWILPKDHITNSEGVNPYGLVPAVEFYENEERQSVFEQIITLQDELDHVMSQKANQIAYFDNAYMFMFRRGGSSG